MQNLLTHKFDSEKESIRAQIHKAVSAIKKYADKKETERNESTQSLDLLPEPEAFNIGFGVTKIPVKSDFKFHTIELPHDILDKEKQSFCLLVRDPKEKAVEKIKAENLPIEKVIAVKSLKRKYASNESRKELANRFDRFFCEIQIYEMMGKLLGSYFFENKKIKIPFALKKINKKFFEKAMRTTRFRVRGGSNVGIRIGDRSMSVEALVDNAMTVVEYMVKIFCPKINTNIHHISLGATNVIELPVWSVPVAIEESEAVQEASEAPATEAPVTVETPKKKRKATENTAEEPLVSLDLASAPVKMLKKVQAAKVEKVKEQLSAAIAAPAKKTTTAKRAARK